MVDKGVIEKILTYLKEKGSTNTFRLASVMGLERAELLNLLKKLEGRQAIRFECGNAIFLKFVSGEKPKPAEIQEKSLTSKKVVIRKPTQSKKVQLLQTENKQLRENLSKLKETVKKLENKAGVRPKTITRTITKTIIKKVPIIRTVIKKIQSPPKIITKIITKKVPVIKTVVKKNPVQKSQLTKEVWKKLKTQSKKLKMPVSKLLENIKQLKEPEFMK